MKITVFLSLMLTAFYASAEEKVVPLDMELGYWEVKTEIIENAMLKQMLANTPEAERPQIRAMMENSMKLPVVKQCVTEEDLNSMDQQIRDSLKGQSACQFKILTTTSKELKGEFNCSGSITIMHTKVINSKRHEADVVTTSAEMGVNKLKTISEWKGAECPADAE